MNPLISIIVPIYKVEAYLRRCIDSILSQTYKNLEIILVDDGSPDSCGTICDEYAEKDQRVIVIHKKNAGVGFARNSGIEVFTGHYVMFVDSDDYLSLECVEVLYRRLVADKSDIAVGNYVKIFDNGEIKEGYTKYPKDFVVSTNQILASYQPHLIYVTPWGKLYKRDIIKKISYPQLRCGEDTWVFEDIISQCGLISFINKPLYYYYQRSDSIVHSKDERKIYDSINADLRLSSFLVRKKLEKNASLLFASCIDRALLLDGVSKRTILFKVHFNSRTRKLLLKEVDFKTKIKWIALCIPYANRIRDIYIKLKKHVLKYNDEL